MKKNSPRNDNPRPTLREYIARVIDTAGSDLAVGKFLGLADGSRVGAWRKGQGRPSELMCVKLARWQNHDPMDVLRIAGYEEMADLLEGAVPQVTGSNIRSVQHVQSQLSSLRKLIDVALEQAKHMEVEGGAEAYRHTTAQR
jgi:hypothetical protein